MTDMLGVKAFAQHLRDYQPDDTAGSFERAIEYALCEMTLAERRSLIRAVKWGVGTKPLPPTHGKSTTPT